MKKLALWVLLCTGVAAADTRSLICREVPAGCQVSQIGGRAVIYDARGFFVGYYRPAPPPVEFVPALASGPRSLWVPRAHINSMYADSDFSSGDGGGCSGDAGDGPSGAAAGNDYADSCVSPLSSPSHGF